MKRLCHLLALVVCLLATRVSHAEAVELPSAQVDVIEHLGEKIPLDVLVTDQNGRQVPLGERFNQGRPVLLSLVYYECPSLCDMVSQGLVRSMRSIDLELGKDYDAVTLSFDPQDTVQAAVAKRKTFIRALNVTDSPAVWPFFTADASTIQKLTEAVGFQYAPVPGSRDMAHAAVVFVLAPDGTLSRYLYGVSFPPRDLRLALVEASAGKIGTTLDRVLLRCYRYDPASRRYAFFISSYIRIGGLVILLLVGGLLYRLWRREMRANA